MPTTSPSTGRARSLSGTASTSTAPPWRTGWASAPRCLRLRPRRAGVALDRSALADWVGTSAALLEPLADAIGRHGRAGEAIFADDTPVAMLAPRPGRTPKPRPSRYGGDDAP